MSAEQISRVRPELDLCWEPFGDHGPRLLLIIGLGSQMLLWPRGLCEALADAGHQVVRFDNRDVGRSTWLDHLPSPSMRRMAASWLSGGRVRLTASYDLGDMADDAAALMDALGWEDAHVVGASMGGMIAQELSVRHPGRVATLTSIMSAPRPTLPPATGLRNLFRGPKSRDRAAYVEHLIRVFEGIGGPHIRADRPQMRQMAEQMFERGIHPEGFLRHLAAILASGDRRAALSGVRAPTLVIHGAVDGMVPVSAGRETARSIPGAQLLVLDEMGHDLPTALWPRLVEAISAHVGQRTEQAQSA